jgi:hypothetical protein
MHNVATVWLCHDFGNDYDNQFKNRLYAYLNERLSTAHDKMERHRTGGSGGIASPTSNVFRLFRQHGSTPRQARGVIWVPHGTLWSFFYISPYKSKRTVCSNSYSQPQRGGQFQVSKTVLMRMPLEFKVFLRMFCHVKAITSCVFYTLNEEVFGPLKMNLCCVEATAEQLRTNEAARMYANNRGIATTNTKFYRQFTQYLIQHCSFTVVSYPVGLHVDASKRNGDGCRTPFIESKVVFNVPAFNENDCSTALGRGGLGRGKFVVALIDHSAT